jgi:hypothetical protein
MVYAKRPSYDLRSPIILASPPPILIKSGMLLGVYLDGWGFPAITIRVLDACGVHEGYTFFRVGGREGFIEYLAVPLVWVG